MTVHISQSYRNTFSEGSTYLINTSKVIKGHKATLKQNIRKMVMKSRNSSRANQSVEGSSRDKEFKDRAKYTEYSDKYRGLDSIEDPDNLLRFIIYQRGKQSNQNKRALKLFSRPQSSQKPYAGRIFSAQNHRTSLSHQTNRTSISNRSSLTQTISYQIHNSLNNFSLPQSQVFFTTENIDIRTNEYLNLILQSKEKGEMHINEDDIKNKQFQLSNSKTEVACLPSSQPQYQHLANNFFKKMKRQRKNKPEMHPSPSVHGSEELVKSLKRTFKQFSQIQKCYEEKSGRRSKMTRSTNTGRSHAMERPSAHPSFMLSPQTEGTAFSTPRGR